MRISLYITIFSFTSLFILSGLIFFFAQKNTAILDKIFTTIERLLILFFGFFTGYQYQKGKKNK